MEDTPARSPRSESGGPEDAAWEFSGSNRDLLSTGLAETLGVDEQASAAIFSGLARTQPDANTTSVYLDINHWIGLAKAAAGHRDGARFAPTLERLQGDVAAGRIVVPLSSASYHEVSNITSVRQRADVASVMAPISQFVTLAARKSRMRCEFAAALSASTGRPRFPERLRPLGIGLAFAFGVGDGPMGQMSWPDDMPQDRDPRHLDELTFRLNQVAEYVLLRGPRPEDIAKMSNYDLGPTRKIVEAEASREQELLEMLLKDRGQISRIGDIVHARGLYWELGPHLPEWLAQGGMSLDTFFAKDKAWLTTFLDDIPALAIRTALVMQADKNSSRAWTTNDIYDIAALEAAVPYCDIVVTERHACHVMNASGLARRFQTAVVNSLDEVGPLIDEIGAIRDS
jgi:hypothetical protein